MKNLTCAFLMFFLAGCSSNGTYEKTIASYLQTDKQGSVYDLKFKALEIKEIEKVTVADSIKAIHDKFEEKRGILIEGTEKTLNANKESLERKKNGFLRSQTMIQFYTDRIEEKTKYIDSLKRLPLPPTPMYDNRNQNEILSIIVLCKYSILDPLSKIRKESTKEFLLSGDGKKCYGMRKAQI